MAVPFIQTTKVVGVSGRDERLLKIVYARRVRARPHPRLNLQGLLASIVDTYVSLCSVSARPADPGGRSCSARKGGATEERSVRPHQQEKGRSHDPREHLPHPGVLFMSPRSRDRSVRNFEPPEESCNASSFSPVRGTPPKTRPRRPTRLPRSPAGLRPSSLNP